MMLRPGAWLAVTAVVLASAPARAESTKVQCIQANTNAQTLRREGKLAEARAQLRACSESKCPSLVSADCIKRLDELETAQPTVIFDVFDTSGHEVNDVSVTIDGHQVAAKLGGASLPVDLGEHEVTFTVEGRPPVTQKLTFREGEKGRHVRITLESAPGAASAEPAEAPPPASEQDATSSTADSGGSTSGRTQRTVGYIVGGVGLGGLAAGGVFGFLAMGAKDRQIDNCASPTDCPNHDAASSAHNDAKTFGTVSTIAFIAGGAATATGIVLVLTSKSGNRNAASTNLVLSPDLGMNGAGARLSGTW
jgi:hypothetical protein